MSMYSWNLGMDDAANGSPVRENKRNDEDYCAGYAYASPQQDERVPEYPEQPTPDFEPEVLSSSCKICGGKGWVYVSKHASQTGPEAQEEPETEPCPECNPEGMAKLAADKAIARVK